MSQFDVAVIGSGPGGYVAAIRCAQLGMKTALIEKYNTLGGTCLNVGCIPSKSLLDSSHHYEDAIKHFDTHGIEIPGEIKVNFEKMIARKRGVVEQTTKGIDFLMEKNKITVFNGLGSFVDATHIKIEGEKQPPSKPNIPLLPQVPNRAHCPSLQSTKSGSLLLPRPWNSKKSLSI